MIRAQLAPSHRARDDLPPSTLCALVCARADKQMGALVCAARPAREAAATKWNESEVKLNLSITCARSAGRLPSKHLLCRCLRSESLSYPRATRQRALREPSIQHARGRTIISKPTGAGRCLSRALGRHLGLQIRLCAASSGVPCLRGTYSWPAVPLSEADFARQVVAAHKAPCARARGAQSFLKLITCASTHTHAHILCAV